MNDPKNPNNPPPDDFSKTTPYFRVPKEELPEQSTDYTSDWEKTNYIINPQPRQTPRSDDEWGKTAVNINIPRPNQDDDFGKTFMPGQMPSPQQPKTDWDVTQANFNINQNDFGGSPRQQNDYGATMPFIQLPESERARLRGGSVEPQNNPSAQQNASEQNEDKKGGTPAWLLYAGVGGVFLMLAVMLVLGYFLFSNKYGYDVIVKGAQPNSDVFVDKTRWGTTAPDGSIKLSGLSAGKHNIEISHPNYTYEPETVDGTDGGKTVEVIAKWKSKVPEKPKTDECSNIKKGEFEKAARCANEALDKLGDNFSVEDLLRAMNLYIINFDSGKYDIKPNDMKFLEKASGYMKKLPPNVKIEVGGHTDNVGNDASNQKLSENRAKAVRDALVKLGVKEEMLEMRGYGKTRPKTSNDTEDGKFQNRRIEYTAIIR